MYTLLLAVCTKQRLQTSDERGALLVRSMGPVEQAKCAARGCRACLEIKT